MTTCSSGGPGDDFFLGDSLSDGTISGQAGNDRALLGDGSDAAIGDNNGVHNIGDAGNDYLDGGSGDDFFLIGDSSWTDPSATFEGTAGDDTLIGGAGRVHHRRSQPVLRHPPGRR